MTQFKKGDKVRCIRRQFFPKNPKAPKLGSVYEVQGSDSIYVYLYDTRTDEVTHEGREPGVGGWISEHFRLVEPGPSLDKGGNGWDFVTRKTRRFVIVEKVNLGWDVYFVPKHGVVEYKNKVANFNKREDAVIYAEWRNEKWHQGETK